MRIKCFLFALSFLTISLFLTVSTIAQTKRRPIVSNAKSTTAGKGVISVEAGLVYNSGDVKPAARVDFYLLDNDLETVIKNAGIEEKNLVGMNNNMSFVTKLAFWKKFASLYETEYPQAVEAIKQHTVLTMTTDFSGKGSFSAVKSGKYWLVGIGGANQIIIWNLPVEIKAGKKSVTLDNKNSAVIL